MRKMATEATPSFEFASCLLPADITTFDPIIIILEGDRCKHSDISQPIGERNESTGMSRDETEKCVCEHLNFWFL